MHTRRRAAGLTRILVTLAVLATGVAIAAPAEAKTPSRSPEATLKCTNGKKAKIWWQGTKHVEIIDDDEVISWEVTQFAVDNKCKEWLYFDVRTVAESESDCCHGVQVAPGANFTKTNKDVPSADTLFGGYGDPAAARETEKECVDPDGGHNQVRWDVAKNGKVTTTEDCRRKYPESERRRIYCPESWNPTNGRYDKWAEGIWKVDDKKILKLAARNPCDAAMIFWWKTKDGKRIALWVGEKSSASSGHFDLWKDELDPLPRTTKDGAVHFIEGPKGPPTEDAAAYDQNWRLSKGKLYQWAATSGVSCGSRIRESVILTKDLHCKKDGLKIGAHGVTINLNGHEIIGPGKPGTKGIQNSGYDNVTIVDGTVRGFDRGIELRKGAHENEILGMVVRGGHYGLVLFDSDNARVDGNSLTAGRAKDGYEGGFGAAIALYRSHDNWFEEIGSRANGVNVVVLKDSHRNGLTEIGFVGDGPPGEGAGGDGTGLMLLNSDNNEIAGNTFAENTNDGIFIDGKSTGNTLSNNVAINNGKLGINVQGKASVGNRPNRAFGNGWKAQCRGIPCLNE